jgi:DNA adenine methylase
MSKVPCIISRPGGKARLLKHLLPLPPHTCYVEVFGGGLAVFRAKERSKVEVINDLDDNLANLYRVLKYHEPELERELALHLNSRSFLRECRTNRGFTDIQRAARYLHANAISFGGEGLNFGIVKQSGGGASKSLKNKLAACRDFAARLDGVICEHLDWRRVLALYDGPETLFFLDPPYVGGAQKCYSPWTLEQMQELADALRTVKGNWLLTVGGTVEMQAMFAQAPQQLVQRGRCINNNAKVKEPQFAELIVRKPSTES